jgi:hypothetical protein
LCTVAPCSERRVGKRDLESKHFEPAKELLKPYLVS